MPPAAANRPASPPEDGPSTQGPQALPGSDNALCVYLKSSRATAVTLTFDDLEQLLGTRLPPAACESEQWWANDPSLPHAEQGWLAAGWRASLIDLAGRTATFSRRR